MMQTLKNLILQFSTIIFGQIWRKINFQRFTSKENNLLFVSREEIFSG